MGQPAGRDADRRDDRRLYRNGPQPYQRSLSGGDSPDGLGSVGLPELRWQACPALPDTQDRLPMADVPYVRVGVFGAADDADCGRGG
jgi:hypothetical protein